MVKLFKLLLVLLAVPAAAEWQSARQDIMGTQISVTLFHPDATTRNQTIAAVMDEMHRIDREFSPYKPESQLSQLNAHGAQKPQPVSAELFALIQGANHFSELSHGAFDITFASVGFHYDYRNKKAPSQKQTEQLLPAINYQWLELNKKAQTVFYGHENVRIDLGGIAKGYAVDRAIGIIKDHGIAHATVSAGGDSRVLGDKRGKPWLIGIKNPRLNQNAEREFVITLPLADTAISTSGDYERYFINETGERIHHIINPKTGRAADELMSVTVLGPEGMATDALSTTVFVLGAKDGLALINQLNGFDCVVIRRDGKVFYSEGLMPPQAKANTQGQ